MAITITGQYTSGGPPMQAQSVTCVYMFNVPSGVLATTADFRFVEAQYVMRVVTTKTDSGGNYSFSLAEDLIIFYAILPGAWFYNAPSGGGVTINPFDIYIWGAFFGNPAFLGSAQVGLEGILSTCTVLAESAEIPNGLPMAVQVDTSVGPRYSADNPIFTTGVVCVLATRDGTNWNYLSSPGAVDIDVPSYVPKVAALGFCLDTHQTYAISGVTLDVIGQFGSESVTTGSDGMAALSVVDPNVITNVRATSGVPDCSILSTYNLWVPPAYGFDIFAHTSEYSPVCGVSAGALSLLFCDCANTGTHAALQADAILGQIVVAWTDSAGKLWISANRQPQRDIGQATQHWDTPYSLETSGASDLGLVFLPSGILYLCYDLSGSKKFRTSRKRASGGAGSWSASGSPSPSVSRHSASSRGQEQAFRFRALGSWGPPLTAGNVEFSQCRDNAGLTWTSPTTAVTGARGPLCGGTWLGNGYGLLYARDSDGHILFLSAPDPTSWSGAGTDTTFTGQAASLAQNRAGAMVGLNWDSAAQTCKILRSRDRGQTWEQDTDALVQIPALPIPPVLVSQEHIIYAVYVVNGAPTLIGSVDDGKTWK